MRNHLHNRAFQRPRLQLHLIGKQEHAQGSETHVADRGIGHQFFHIGLYQSHHADVNHRNQAEHDDGGGKIARRIGQDGQDEAQKAVCAEFQRNRRQHHRTAGGRFHVRIGQPSVHREHRYFHRKRQEEGGKQNLLGKQRNLFEVLEIFNREAAAGLERQIHQGHQHQQRAHQGVEEEFYRGIHAARPAPHADNQIQRNQHAFEENIEQHGIAGGKRAVDQAGHNQEGRHVLGHLFLNHFPARKHHHQRDEGVEDDKQHGNAVHAQRVVDVERGNPRIKLGKLEAATQAVELRKQRQRNQKTGQRADKSQYPRQGGTAVAAGSQHQ